LKTKGFIAVRAATFAITLCNGSRHKMTRPVKLNALGCQSRPFGYHSQIAAEDAVALGPGGVEVGKIEVVMEAAAFGALQGAIDNEFGDGGDVAQFQEVAIDHIAPIIFEDFVLQIDDAAAGALQALVGADDADIIPHEAAQLVPIVGDDDHFVGVEGLAGMPGRNLEGDGRLWAEARLFGGAMGADERFEQGIAGQPIGAVQAGAGHLAHGVKSRDVGAAIDIGNGRRARRE
jgi:hypothetical protein